MINGILFHRRTGIPWRDLPTRFGKWKTCHDRHRRWSAGGTWENVLRSVQTDADAEDRIDWSMVGIDSTTCRAHQHAAGARRRPPRIPRKRIPPAQHRPDEALGRSRGGLTTKIHLAGDGGCRPLAVLITPGQWGDAPQLIRSLSAFAYDGRVAVTRAPGLITSAAIRRTHPVVTAGTCAGAGSSTPSPNRGTSGPTDSTVAAGSAHRLRQVALHKSLYKRRNEVERTINALKGFRAVASRFDKRAYIFQGTVTVAAVRLWLRS